MQKRWPGPQPAMPFRARTPTQPCLPSRHLGEVCRGRCPGWAGGPSAPQSPSAALHPWLRPLSCPLGLPTPRKGHVMEKLLGRRQEAIGWGPDQRRADKGKKLVRGVARAPGTEDRYGARRSAGGLPPNLVSGSPSMSPVTPLIHSFPCYVLGTGRPQQAWPGLGSAPRP